MSEQLFFDSLSSICRLLDSGYEQSVEQEILLADYDPAVFKIVKTCIEHTLTQKYISAGKLVLEGFFRLSIYYQPPASQQLAMISKKIPFQKQFDVSADITSPYFIDVSGEVQYVNTRAINPTRIDVRGAYQFFVKAYGVQPVQVITAVGSKSVCTDSAQLEYFCLAGQAIRQFSAEDELTMPENSGQILHVNAKNNNMNITVYQDKVNVKGEVAVDVWHTVADDFDVQKYTKTFVYNQVIDISGISENNIAYVDFSLISFTVTQNPDTKKVMGVLTAQLDARVFRKQQVIAAVDAFSKAYQYTEVQQQVSCDETIIAVNKNIAVTIEDEIGKNYVIGHTLLDLSAPQSYMQDDVGTIKLKVGANVIVKNEQNELECFSKTDDVIVDVGQPVLPEYETVLSSALNDVSAAINGEKLKVKANITVSGFIVKRQKLTLLSAFEEITDKPLDKAADAMVLYYAKKDEKLFEIARRYKTDVLQILNENQLEGKTLAEDKMLFIPAFGL